MVMSRPPLRNLLTLKRIKEINRRSALYDTEPDRGAIEQHQIAAFNATWQRCLAEVPFYRAWAAEHELPPFIGAVSDLESFPALTKSVLVDREDLVFQGASAGRTYSTGGSSGAPARFPRGREDTLARYADVYVGRAWSGIRPFDPYVHLWGHAHLFNASRVSGWKRLAADRLVNATRLNAYDLSEAGLREHAARLSEADPVYIVGYTSAIFKLARFMESNNHVARLTRLKAVVVTAETVTDADVELISRVFSAPVVIQYGGAEIGDVAFSRHGSWPLAVLWYSHIVRLDAAGGMMITTLNKRLFPLINYAIGDVAEPGDVVRGNALSLQRVLGRQQDVVRLRSQDGRALDMSAILPVHILKGLAGISTVQFKQTADLQVLISADRPLDLADVKDRFFHELKREHASIDRSSVHFVQVSTPVMTKAGKTALFVD